MLRLIIKGTPEQAYSEATTRGVTLANVRLNTHGRAETYATAEDKYLPQVAEWYKAGYVSPYPAGTLLVYSQPDLVETNEARLIIKGRFPQLYAMAMPDEDYP